MKTIAIVPIKNKSVRVRERILRRLVKHYMKLH